jgi:ribonuclease HI
LLIQIYTDGACSGNPGPGGYGVVMMAGEHRKELSDGYRFTTNNRMELLSVIVALESLKKQNSQVTVFSDSRYVVDAIEKKWLNGWIKKGFSKIKNPDLWLRYSRIASKHQVNFIWVKGHANNEHNNYCDQLAVAASKSKQLKIDEGYEAQNNSSSLL